MAPTNSAKESNSASSAAAAQPDTATHLLKSSRRQAHHAEVKDPIRYKTVLCENWKATGTCPYTHKCQFAHGEEDLRVREDKLQRSRGARGGRRINHTRAERGGISSVHSSEASQTSTKNASDAMLPQRRITAGTSTETASDAIRNEEGNDSSLDDMDSEPNRDDLFDGSTADNASDNTGALQLCQEVDAAKDAENNVDGDLAENAVKKSWRAQSLPEVYAPWMHKLSDEPAIGHMAGFEHLGVALNPDTGNVEAIPVASASLRRDKSQDSQPKSRQPKSPGRQVSFRGVTAKRELSFSTLTLRRTMSALLNELSYERSAKQVVEVI